MRSGRNLENLATKHDSVGEANPILEHPAEDQVGESPHQPEAA